MIVADDRKGLPSASKRERWSKCPGSHALEKLAPEQETTEALLKGNRIHDALYKGDLSVLVDEERELAERLVELEREAISQWKKDIGYEGKPLLLKEQRLGFADRGEVRMTGKPDVVYSNDETILVIDYKTGMVGVESTENPQLRALAVLAAEEFGVKTAYVTILQAGNPVVIEKLSESALRMESERLKNELERLETSIDTRVSGPQCQYCRAVGICPEAASQTLALAQIRPETRDLINPSDLPKLLEGCIVAEAVIDAVRARAKEIISGGGEVKGWKVQSVRKRFITDDTEALQRLSEELGTDGALKVASVSLTEAEKAIQAKHKCSKAEAGKRIDALLGELVDRKEIERLMRCK
ncbi:MAG: DUF2800 domain-containing protein [Verrucomicrobia bacterium]|nr:DUF2800 domain-containing protein [Verrucomicrobiota bacterium]